MEVLYQLSYPGAGIHFSGAPLGADFRGRLRAGWSIQSSGTNTAAARVAAFQLPSSFTIVSW
jgi:hypothetical protein